MFEQSLILGELFLFKQDFSHLTEKYCYLVEKPFEHIKIREHIKILSN